MTQNNPLTKLVYLYLSAFVFILLVILIQNRTGYYEDKSSLAWGWLVMHVIPVLATLLFAFLARKKRSATSPDPEHRVNKIVYYLSVFYLAILMLILLLQPFGDLEEPPAQRLHNTDIGLLIVQVLLIILMIIDIRNRSRRSEISNITDGITTSSSPSVFLSYNHLDAETADQLLAKFKATEIEVIIDKERMRSGESIQKFIENSILNTSVTVSLVSRNSLLSGWVSYETINTFFFERFFPEKKFIAAYTDPSFFELGFSAEAITHIDQKLDEIKKQIYQQDQLQLDTRDLNTEKSKLLALRNNLDGILNRLRSSLCLDVRPGKIEENFPKLLSSIRNG